MAVSDPGDDFGEVGLRLDVAVLAGLNQRGGSFRHRSRQGSEADEPGPPWLATLNQTFADFGIPYESRLQGFGIRCLGRTDLLRNFGMLMSQGYAVNCPFRRHLWTVNAGQQNLDCKRRDHAR
jgi:hypothetical protein